MAKKILFCATVDYHFKAFHLPYMKWFKEQGWKVDVAANGELELPWVDKKYNVPMQRSPFDKRNFAAYKELKKVISQNEYQIIHCHTPVGGMLGRFAARHARKRGTKVIYTAHGFHFCKGAPLVNWLAYYPIEKSMARYTDCLITINEEDYQLASKQFKVGRVEHIHGVGIDTDKFCPLDSEKKIELKKSFGYQPDDFLLFYAAEFNQNKNQQFLLHALANIKDSTPNARLLLAGEGVLQGNCRELASQLGIEDKVDFLGYRNDIQQLVSMADVAVASSLREGLPVNIMEAMACGLPVIAVDNRGHRELIRNNQNGWIINNNNPGLFSRKIESLAYLPGLKEKLGQNGRRFVLEAYSIDKVLINIAAVYQFYMGKEEKEKWAIR